MSIHFCEKAILLLEEDRLPLGLIYGAWFINFRILLTAGCSSLAGFEMLERWRQGCSQRITSDTHVLDLGVLADILDHRIDQVPETLVGIFGTVEDLLL